MGQRFLIDTNVIIDYTSNRLDPKTSASLEDIFNSDFNTSIIVKIELLGYNDSPGKMQLLEEFLNTAIILSLDNAVAQKTIELRKVKKIKLRDAIIAATALVYGFTIVTRNTVDFINIPGLNCLLPNLTSEI